MSSPKTTTSPANETADPTGTVLKLWGTTRAEFELLRKLRDQNALDRGGLLAAYLDLFTQVEQLRAREDVIQTQLVAMRETVRREAEDHTKTKAEFAEFKRRAAEHARGARMHPLDPQNPLGRGY